MKRQFIALFSVAALMALPLLISQDHWWAFILATLAIMAALRLLLGRDWQSGAGLRISPVHALSAIAAFVLIAVGSAMLLPHVYAVAGLRANAPALKDQIGFLFQAFNEEILFRALMIGLLVQYVRSAPVVSLALALVFVAPHFLMYRFTNPMHFALSMAALGTLFCAGVAMNNLYLAFRHIGFSWALHAGWNLVWLPAAIYDSASHQRLHEPQIFDRVLGSPTVVAAACAMAVLTFALLARRGGTAAITHGADI
jgi:membrane protease YdiL (CAAX protease family)